MNKDTQSWSNSNLTEMEELLQKMQQLQRENAALREENRKAHDMACEDAVERYRLNGENAALREEVKEQCTLNAKGSEREYSLRGRIEQLERENAALREKMKVSWDEISVLVNQNSALLEALKTIAKYDQNSPHGDGICPYGCDCPSIANTALIKARKEAQP
jgi:hypothetical protein